MGRRGPKSWEECTRSRVVPFRIIAARMGISERTATYIYKEAVRKLRNTPGAFDALLCVIRGHNTETKELIRCASIECRDDKND